MKQHRPVRAPQPAAEAVAAPRETSEAYGNAAAQEALFSGQEGALPYRSEMETLFGADFSDVTATFGADLGGIDANAAASGNQLAFAEAEPDRETVAHELTHVVQARGEPAGEGMSAPGDAAEVEAEAIAGNVGQGRPAGPVRASARGVHRQKKSYAGQTPPNKSYLRGDMPSWDGGQALKEDEYKEYVAKTGAAFGAAITLFGKVFGIGVADSSISDKLVAEAEAAIDADLADRQAEINHFESQVDYLEDLDEPTARQREILAEYIQRLSAAEAALKRAKAGREGALERITATAKAVTAEISAYAGSVFSIGAAFNQTIAGVAPSQFQDLADATGKLDDFVNAAHLVAAFADRSGIDAFKADPSFETAKAWGAEVGRVFEASSVAVKGFPLSWGTVISGALAMPAKVIAGFTGLMERRIQELDDALHGYDNNGSKLLKEGTYG